MPADDFLQRQIPSPAGWTRQPWAHSRPPASGTLYWFSQHLVGPGWKFLKLKQLRESRGGGEAVPIKEIGISMAPRASCGNTLDRGVVNLYHYSTVAIVE